MADARSLWRRCLRLQAMMPKAQSDYYYRYSKQVQALTEFSIQDAVNSAFWVARRALSPPSCPTRSLVERLAGVGTGSCERKCHVSIC